jgi:hypothetical protein
LEVHRRPETARIIDFLSHLCAVANIADCMPLTVTPDGSGALLSWGKVNVKKLHNQLVSFPAFRQAGFIPEPVRESLEDDKLRVVARAKERTLQDRCAA